MTVFRCSRRQYYTTKLILSAVDPAAVALSAAPSAAGVALPPAVALAPPAATAALPAAAVPALPMAPPTSQRSLRRQTSTSFNALTAAPPRPDSPSHVAIYSDLGLSLAPAVGAETAAANRVRHGDNERIIAQGLWNVKNDIASKHLAVMQRIEELTLMLTDARIGAAREAAAVTAADLHELRTSVASTRSSLSGTINAVNDLKGLRTEVNELRTSLASAARPAGNTHTSTPFTAVSAPFTAISDPLPAIHSAPVTVMHATTATIPAIRAAEDDTAQFTKRQRTTAPSATESHHDVFFSPVSATTEPREIARTVLQQIPGLSATVPAHSQMLFVFNEPPRGLEGMHAAWAPTSPDPISLIRGEGFNGQSG
ncbi:hypothetical protein B0H14DRAFT_3529332 [Mycena olivaceomarginata]|nr:hypothetical protein B0H14DRAFT_3529332 [Mycena olivaceomarginata]